MGWDIAFPVPEGGRCLFQNVVQGPPQVIGGMLWYPHLGGIG